MRLHNYVLTNGLLDIAPDFAQQLHSTTEDILSLVRRLDDDGDDDELANNAQESVVPCQRINRASCPEVPQRTMPLEETTRTHVLGYNFMTEYEMMAPVHMIDHQIALPNSTTPLAIQKPVYYDDIHMPLFDNTSYPFPSTADPNLCPDLTS